MDWLVHVDGAEELRQLSPDMLSLSRLPGRGWIVTSASDTHDYDFLSRFFGPAVGVPEDPSPAQPIVAWLAIGPIFWGKRGWLDIKHQVEVAR